MSWCPECRTEYRDGFTICNDCNSVLVDKWELPEENATPEYDKESFLISVGNNLEADMVEVLLNANGIPVLKKYKETGDYLKIYMGGTIFGVDIYVPSKLLGEAQDIIENNKALSNCDDLQTGDWEAQDEECQSHEAESNEEQDQEPQEQKPQEQKPQEQKPQEQEPQEQEPQEEEQEPQSEEYQDEEISDKESEAFNRTRRIRTWIIIALFVPGVIWIIGALIYKLYIWLTGK